MLPGRMHQEPAPPGIRHGPYTKELLTMAMVEIIVTMVMAITVVVAMIIATVGMKPVPVQASHHFLKASNISQKKSLYTMTINM